MLALMDRAFQPSTSIQDLTVYLTSVKSLQTISTNEQQVSEKIKSLLATTKTRLQGLILLQVALEQCPDIFFKGKWLIVVFKTFEDPTSKLMKELACSIMCIAIKILAKHPAGYDEEIKKCKNFLFPFLLSAVDTNCEWTESALELLLICLKYFGRDFEGLKEGLLKIIISNCAHATSSKAFELYADCFSVLPACMRNQDHEDYQENWFSQYITTLKSMIYTLNTLLFQPDDSDEEPILEDVAIYPVDCSGEDDIFSAYMKSVRVFINLCKCLTKMLSSKSLFPVKIPIKITLDCVCRLFRVNDFIKVDRVNIESQLFLSVISQLQIAALEILEPLLLNFNMNKFKFIVFDIMISALHSSTLTVISSETISPIRHIIWKLLNIWLEVNSLISSDIVHSTLVQELLKDISTEDVLVQASGQQSRSKTKKNTSANVDSKINFMNNNKHIACIEALEVLRNILYRSGSDISSEMYQDLFSKVVSATNTVLSQLNPAFPYDDERCRKKLYTVLLAIAVNSKSDQRDIFTTSFGILQNVSHDPSSKVASLHQQINVMGKTIFHPKKALPLYTSLENTKKRPDISNAAAKFSDWIEEDQYTPNIPPVVEKISDVSENVTPRISQTFHNPADSEMPPNDFVVDTHYPEAAAENRCNGDDILELPNSSQCQEDVEESDEDEEEEEDDEEEMNQEMDIQTEHMYIPSTSEMQVLNPVSVNINPETVHPNVAEQEYEELGPCAKSQANVVDNKSQQNGAPIVPDEMQSTSIQNVANENGIYASEDEEMEEEEGEEDEEEEEVTLPAEKKIPVFSESPAKMPKLENENEVKSESQEEEMDQRSRSPTLAEMKADFHYCEVEDVKS